MASASTPNIHSLQNCFPNKLKHDNYRLWKTQVVPQLKGVDVYGFVDGSKPAPPQEISMTFASGVVTTIANPDYIYWSSQDNLILGALISSIEESLITHVVHCKTSREVWTTLDRMFASQSQARVMQSHFQLATLNKGSSSIVDYFHKFKILWIP
jgi:hypothetical protein